MFVIDNDHQESVIREERPKMEQISVKFSKGLVGETFTGKDGREYASVKIPNRDKDDHTPWASFVVPANKIHEDQFGGKGVFIYLPKDGHTTVTKPVLTGQDENGKNIWENRKTFTPNTELKEMVEYYKTRDRSQDQGRSSVTDQLKNAQGRSGQTAPGGTGSRKQSDPSL